MGEGSEGWSDFYGSVRSRHVDSDDVRDALWATDEFESDEVGCAAGAERRLWLLLLSALVLVWASSSTPEPHS
jgi:hypothetical protein